MDNNQTLDNSCVFSIPISKVPIVTKLLCVVSSFVRNSIVCKIKTQLCCVPFYCFLLNIYYTCYKGQDTNLSFTLCSSFNLVLQDKRNLVTNRFTSDSFKLNKIVYNKLNEIVLTPG